MKQTNYMLQKLGGRLLLLLVLVMGVLPMSSMKAVYADMSTIGPGAASCPANRLCLWEHANYAGQGRAISGNQAYIHDMNDMTSSVINNTGATYFLFQHGDYGGGATVVNPGQWISYVGNAANDRISSAAAIPVIGNGLNSCPANRVCVWEHANYANAGRAISGNVAYLGEVAINDAISSVFNNTGVPVRFYVHANYQGGVLVVQPYTAIAYVGATWNDKFSSVRQ